MTLKFLNHHLNLLFATKHYAYQSKDPESIAHAVCVSVDTVKDWMQSFEWLEALSHWHQRYSPGDLCLAERVWTDIVENESGFHLCPEAYPEHPFKSSITDDPQYALQSHLSIEEGLCEAQLRARLAEAREFDGNPVAGFMYDRQHHGNAYCWWLYPNWDKGIFSKVFARVNCMDMLVVGSAENTHLVCIQDGHLALTRNPKADVVNIYDKRLRVCL